MERKGIGDLLGRVVGPDSTDTFDTTPLAIDNRIAPNARKRQLGISVGSRDITAAI